MVNLYLTFIFSQVIHPLRLLQYGGGRSDEIYPIEPLLTSCPCRFLLALLLKG